jgi:hypothetical protein
VPRDERPILPRRPRSVDAAPSAAEVAQAWPGKPPPPLSLAEKQARAARSEPELEDEQDELGEGERQRVKRAVRDLTGR